MLYSGIKPKFEEDYDMKSKNTVDILMIVALALMAIAGPVMWGLYALGAGISLTILGGLMLIAGAALCFEEAFEMAETETEGEETKKKEERL